MKLGEIVVHMDNYNFTKFHQDQMKNKKVLITDPLMEVSSVKVPLRSCSVVGEFSRGLKKEQNDLFRSC